MGWTPLRAPELLCSLAQGVHTAIRWVKLSKTISMHQISTRCHYLTQKKKKKKAQKLNAHLTVNFSQASPSVFSTHKTIKSWKFHQRLQSRMSLSSWFASCAIQIHHSESLMQNSGIEGSVCMINRGGGGARRAAQALVLKRSRAVPCFWCFPA